LSFPHYFFLNPSPAASFCSLLAPTPAIPSSVPSFPGASSEPERRQYGPEVEARGGDDGNASGAAASAASVPPKRSFASVCAEEPVSGRDLTAAELSDVTSMPTSSSQLIDDTEFPAIPLYNHKAVPGSTVRGKKWASLFAYFFTPLYDAVFGGPTSRPRGEAGAFIGVVVGASSGKDEEVICPTIGIVDRFGYQHVLSISPPDENIAQQLPAPPPSLHPRGLLPRRKAEEGVGQQETVLRTRSQKEAVILTATETVGTQHSMPGSVVRLDVCFEVTKDN
uniref:Transferred entry: 7.1.2.2 n=1 Tax=Schistocephalus solidus TaxID=70667 RepID=A0A183T6A6_SCHSO